MIRRAPPSTYQAAEATPRGVALSSTVGLPTVSSTSEWPDPTRTLMARDVHCWGLMHVAVEALDVPVADEVLIAVDREVKARMGSAVFKGVRDLRLRLRQTKGALLCVAAVGFFGGDLVTSTATSNTPLEAIVGALEGLPERIDRVHPRVVEG